MKCQYGDKWLTGTPWQEDCGEVVLTASQLLEVVALIERQSPAINTHGNISDSVPVPIWLEIGDQLEAMGFMASLPWDLPASGTLRFEEQIGNRTLTVRYPNAAFQTVQRKRHGVSVELLYQFIVTGPPEVNIFEALETLTTEGGLPLTTESGEPIEPSP